MIRKIAVGAAACVLCSASYGFDGVSYQAGRGDDHTYLLRIGLTSAWRERQPPQPDWHLAGYWEIFFGLWDNPDNTTAEAGITPVFRLQRARHYVEGAIGLHLVQSHISSHRHFSTAIQFGTHAGVGMYFGKYDLGVRFQHISNSGIDSPNPGINFWLVRLRYALE